MAAHHLGRHELQEAALDANTLDGIDAVAGPEAVAMGDDASIDPPAPTGAGLDLDMGEGGGEAVHQRIAGMDLAAIEWGLAGVGQVAVMVPFEIGDGQAFQQRGDFGEEIVTDLGSCEIEH